MRYPPSLVNVVKALGLDSLGILFYWTKRFSSQEKTNGAGDYGKIPFHFHIEDLTRSKEKRATGAVMAVGGGIVGMQAALVMGGGRRYECRCYADWTGARDSPGGKGGHRSTWKKNPTSTLDQGCFRNKRPYGALVQSPVLWARIFTFRQRTFHNSYRGLRSRLPMVWNRSRPYHRVREIRSRNSLKKRKVWKSSFSGLRFRRPGRPALPLIG